jgi:hypothetical protein
MKMQKITKENLPKISQRLSQFFERYDTLEWSGDWGWLPKYKNKLGINNNLTIKRKGFFTERPETFTFRSNKTDFRAEETGCYYACDNSDNILSFNIGDKIKITPYHIFLRSSKLSFIGTLNEVITPINQ